MGQLGLGYHPDTPFGDYVSEDGTSVYTSEEARTLDELTEKAFRLLDPYEVGMREFHKLIQNDDVP